MSIEGKESMQEVVENETNSNATTALTKLKNVDNEEQEDTNNQYSPSLGHHIDESNIYQTLYHNMIMESSCPTTMETGDNNCNESWHKMFEKLKAVVLQQQTGEIDNESEQSKQLQEWIISQQNMYEAYKMGLLEIGIDDTRIYRCQCLESIGYGAILSTSTEDLNEWNQMFHHLVEFLQRNSTRIHEDPWTMDVDLYNWFTSNQDMIFEYRVGLFDNEQDICKSKQSKLLENIGYQEIASKVQLDKNDAKWDEMFEKLKECRKNKQDITQYPSINEWKKQQICMYHSYEEKHLDVVRHKIKIQRSKLLESISFGSSSTRWNSMFRELKKFKQMNNNSNVPKTNKELWNWLNKQRTKYSRYKYRKISSKLDVDDFERCQLLEGVVNDEEMLISKSKEYVWNALFEELKEYKRVNNYLNVNSRSKPKLYRWKRKQTLLYKEYKTGQLDPERDAHKIERCSMLESIGFDQICNVDDTCHHGTSHKQTLCAQKLGAFDIQDKVSTATKSTFTEITAETDLEKWCEDDNDSVIVSDDGKNPICVCEDIEKPANVILSEEDFEFMRSGLSWGVWI